ncbi:MAG: SDR family oxidoreductase [Bacteroidetes bacterium]|nr:SDR family oxidoreductase [Bacteroidota bacterium]
MINEVVITGAGRGIGHALAQKFSACGWKVYAISRNVEAFKQVEGVIGLQADLTDSKQLEDAVHKIGSASKASAFRVVINNAGLLLNRKFEDMGREEFKKMQAINFDAPFFLTQKLMPWLEAANKGHVLFIGSMGGFQGSSKYPGLSLYSALKSAVAGLGECLAVEYSNTNIRFNTICPGAVDTEMLQEAFPGFVSGVSAEQMASFIYDFASSGYDLFNGKIIPVAGANP